MHSMQAGYMDKAQKYTDKALMQIEKLKSECNKCLLQHVASLQNSLRKLEILYVTGLILISLQQINS